VDVRVVPSYAPAAEPRRGRDEAAAPVRVWLDAFGKNDYTPNLDHFLVQVNGGAWVTSGPDFSFPPRRGVNRLAVRAVNKFGVQGPVTICDIGWAGGLPAVPQLPADAWEAEGVPGN
jgi:hypothetical protein